MTKLVSRLPCAFEAVDELKQRLAGKRIVLFLDYDGTLTPITERPQIAVLSTKMRRCLRDVAKHYIVAIISGRDIDDVRTMVGIDDLIYAGSHGFDIAIPHGEEIHRGENSGFYEVINEIKDRLKRELGHVQGILIEHKKLSVAVHYRLVARNKRAGIKAAVNRILNDNNKLRLIPGKMVYEIQACLDWDKGKAVLWLLQTLKLESDDVIAVYFGDDITDEYAFRALGEHGIGVFVGDKNDPEVQYRTSADYIIKDPDETRRLLQLMMPD